MPKADRVHSTPPTSSPISQSHPMDAPPRAPSASSLCPAPSIRDSRAGASQGLASESEPHATHPTCSSGAGPSMTRRILMNSIVALPIAAAIPVVAPEMAVPASGYDDCRLLEMVDRIFKLRDVIDEFDPEIMRLQEVWSAEVIRLHEENLTGEHSRSQPEQRAIVAAMPECIEYNRLAKLQQPHLDAQDELIEKVLSTPALTPKGKLEKFLVLLNFIMPDDWREDDERADYDIKQARNFMIELIGGEEAEQLSDQFA
jgi:hypothetical protein